MNEMRPHPLADMPMELFAEGIAYAETNFIDEHAPHLKVDKRLLRQHFRLDGKRILDFGCGMGGMSLWYATTWQCEVIGIDIDAHHLAIAQKLQDKYGVRNVRFELRNLLEDPPEGPFDFIAMNDVVEHIPIEHLPQIFRAFSQLLTPEGQLFISYPPWQSPYASHVVHAVGIPWCQYLPEPLLLWLIRRHNKPLVGQLESDLLSAYRGLNQLTHPKLMSILAQTDLQLRWRKSHSILNRIAAIPQGWIRRWPLHLLITKEFVLLEKAHSCLST